MGMGMGMRKYTRGLPLEFLTCHITLTAARPSMKAQMTLVIVWAQVCFYYSFSTNLFFYSSGDDHLDTTPPPSL
jgi:hypothetical protein